MYDPNEYETEAAEGMEEDTIFVLKDGEPVGLEVPDDDDD